MIEEFDSYSSNSADSQDYKHLDLLFSAFIEKLTNFASVTGSHKISKNNFLALIVEELYDLKSDKFCH
jgi:hypothetical protein